MGSLAPSVSFTKEILLAPNSAHPGEVSSSWVHRVCLVLQFSKHFFVTHVLRAGRGVEAGDKDISFGGSTPALPRWRWSMGRSRTASVHLLWPTTHWRKAHVDSVLLACLLSYSPMLRGDVGSSICLKNKTNPQKLPDQMALPSFKIRHVRVKCMVNLGFSQLKCILACCLPIDHAEC